MPCMASAHFCACIACARSVAVVPARCQIMFGFMPDSTTLFHSSWTLAVWFMRSVPPDLLLMPSHQASKCPSRGQASCKPLTLFSLSPPPPSGTWSCRLVS
ncbi:unnamed protein product, partial [Discosporangium mesarthrocarpum]